MSSLTSALWQRLQQLKPALSPEALSARLDAVEAACARGEWAAAGESLRLLPAPSPHADATYARYMALRLVTACERADAPAALDSLATLRKLGPSLGPCAALSLRTLRRLADAFVQARRVKGLSLLLEVAPPLLLARQEPAPAVAYWSGRLWSALAALSADEAAAQRACAEAQRALARAGDDPCATPAQREATRDALVELSLQMAARSGHGLARATWLSQARRPLEGLNPFTLSPRAQLLYAAAFLDSASPWKRVRALDLLDRLGEGALSGAAARLLHRQLAASRALALPTTEGAAAPEADRLRAAAARLLPADLCASLTRRWQRAEAFAAARRRGDVDAALALWAQGAGPHGAILAPVFQALRAGEGRLGDAAAASAGVDLDALVAAAERDPVALGGALVIAALRPLSADDPRLLTLFTLLADPERASDADLKPLSLLLPALLCAAGSPRPLPADLVSPLVGATTRYLSAGHHPAYGLVALARALWRALGATHPGLAAFAALLSLQAPAPAPEAATAQELAAIISAAARHALERRDLAEAARWLSALRAVCEPSPPA